jgi:hypothetical protein
LNLLGNDKTAESVLPAEASRLGRSADFNAKKGESGGAVCAQQRLEKAQAAGCFARRLIKTQNSAGTYISGGICSR